MAKQAADVAILACFLVLASCASRPLGAGGKTTTLSTTLPATSSSTSSSRRPPVCEPTARLPSAFHRRVPAGPLQLWVTGEQRFVVDGRCFASAVSLRSYLRERQRRTPETRAVISADHEVPHGSVVAALEAVRAMGFFKIRIKPIRKSGPGN